MYGMPEHFDCDLCHATQPVELLCTVRPDCLVCAHCCGCPEHDVREMAGTVVLDFTAASPWRGLHGAARPVRRYP